jgi:hypothetical protein
LVGSEIFQQKLKSERQDAKGAKKSRQEYDGFSSLSELGVPCVLAFKPILFGALNFLI